MIDAHNLSKDDGRPTPSSKPIAATKTLRLALSHAERIGLLALIEAWRELGDDEAVSRLEEALALGKSFLLGDRLLEVERGFLTKRRHSLALRNGTAKPVQLPPKRHWTKFTHLHSAQESAALKALPVEVGQSVMEALHAIEVELARRGYTGPGEITTVNASNETLELRRRWSSIGGATMRYALQRYALYRGYSRAFAEVTDMARCDLARLLGRELPVDPDPAVQVKLL